MVQPNSNGRNIEIVKNAVEDFPKNVLKEFLMKKAIIYIICMCIIGSVCSCGLKEKKTESELEVSENVSEIGDNSKEYIEPDIIGDFSDGLAYIIKDGKYGYINKKGEIVIPIEFESDDLLEEQDGSFCEGLACIYKDEGYGYIDKNGNVVIPCIYCCAGDFSDGLASVCKEENGKWGYIDKSGKEVIPCIYDFVQIFSNGLAWVCREENGKWGCIDTNGKEVVPFMYARAMDFSEGLAWVCNEEGKWGCIDKNGDLKIPFIYTNASIFNEDLAVVARGEKWGAVNKKGDVVVPFEYDGGSYKNGFYKFSGGYVILGKVTDYTKRGSEIGNGFYIVDKNGNARDDCNYYIDDFSEGLCMFRDPDAEKYGYLDENLNVKIPAVFDTASRFHDGLALVEKGENRYYIDTNGNIALDKFFIRRQR